jgi:hypothetical protein
VQAATAYSVYDAVALLPPWAQSRRRAPFYFGADFIAFPANGTLSQDIKISDDADFVLTTQACTITNDVNQAVFVAQAEFMVTLTDSGAGRSDMNQPIHISNVFGATGAVSPFVLAQPKILVRASTYTVTLTNLFTVATFSLRFMFSGFKMYGDPLQPGTY